jgi:hypothetical protein
MAQALPVVYLALLLLGLVPPARGPAAHAGLDVHQAECDDSEQRPFRATRRQLNADARDLLDHARAHLDQAFSDRRVTRNQRADCSGGSRRARRIACRVTARPPIRRGWFSTPPRSG